MVNNWRLYVGVQDNKKEEENEKNERRTGKMLRRVMLRRERVICSLEGDCQVLAHAPRSYIPRYTHTHTHKCSLINEADRRTLLLLFSLFLPLDNSYSALSLKLFLSVQILLTSLVCSACCVQKSPYTVFFFFKFLYRTWCFCSERPQNSENSDLTQIYLFNLSTTQFIHIYTLIE